VTFSILGGLSSFNEADTIAKVTTDIDAGLATLPFPAKAQLMNADSSSTDGTPEIFLPFWCRFPVGLRSHHPTLPHRPTAGCALITATGGSLCSPQHWRSGCVIT
jgi:hypothetical protein